MKHFREYNFGNGVTIRPRMELDGVVYAMGDTEPCEVKVFDVSQHGKLRATAETWEQAKDMALSILANTAIRHGEDGVGLCKACFAEIPTLPNTDSAKAGR